jgi:sugar phosphate isomerase/epimerase
MRTPEEYVAPMERVAELGVEGVEIFWPDGASPEEVRGMVEPHGMRVSSITVKSKLTDDDYLEPYLVGAEQASAVGAEIIFTSLKREEMPLDEAADRLRRIGDVAAEHNVRVGLETHPDLCENGGNALETMQAVGHPNVGVNFDTANIYYYNDGASTMDELRKIVDYVVSVHLKDTRGGFKSAEFPVFGEGVVDFPSVFELLNGRGFHGPFTMELEGRLTSRDNAEDQLSIVAGCVEHLRKIGAL